MPHAFFTIGHSTRTLAEFVDLLKGAGVRLVIDVRTVPRSRTNPQYNRDELPGSLAEFQIGYEHIAALGGLRGHKRDATEATNAFWQNKSFHNYADYAMSAEFRAGLDATGRRYLVSTGRYALRGIGRAQDLYTLDPDMASNEAMSGGYERYLKGELPS